MVRRMWPAQEVSLHPWCHLRACRAGGDPCGRTWHRGLLTLSLPGAIHPRAFSPPVTVTVTVTAAGPGHHSSALNVLLRAQSHLPGTRCPWAASHCAGEVTLGSVLCVLFSRAPFISPILFLEDNTPTGLTLCEFSLSAISPSVFLPSLYNSSSWELMMSVGTVPKRSEADGSRLLLSVQKPFPSFPGSGSRFSFPSLRAWSQECSAHTERGLVFLVFCPSLCLWRDIKIPGFCPKKGAGKSE